MGKRATGAIVVLKATDINESGGFTLDDGIHSPTTFEFDKDGVVDADSIPITLMASDTTNVVRLKAVNAINSIGADLEIAASGSGSLITLTHDRFSVIGNVAITETVIDSDFSVSGMSGGIGGDCMTGQACQSNADCVSNVCLPVKVCQ